MSTTTEKIASIAAKLKTSGTAILTEEATKNALIMPFIAQVLGYDVFDPNEVIPEFVADVGTKKGEKIDYAIVKDGAIQILIECKALSAPLSINHASQLFRYFAVTSARIAILTNGREYQVFTDGDRPNVMDSKPFLVLDVADVDRTLVPEIEKLSKASFDVDSVVSAAEELKYVGQIKRLIATQSKEPSDDLVRFFISRIYDGKATAKVVDQFRSIVPKAFAQYVADQVSDRLNSALGDDSRVTAAPQTPEAPLPPAKDSHTPGEAADGIETTQEELDGFNIVRAILAKEIDPGRVAYRDAKAYFAVLLDDNNRKPIVRLHLNGKSVKFVTTFENGKDGERHDIASVLDLYTHADRLLHTVRGYSA